MAKDQVHILSQAITDERSRIAVRQLERLLQSALDRISTAETQIEGVQAGSGVVTSVTGTAPISVSPTTGDVVVSVNLSGYSLVGHTHPESDVINLITDLAGKAPLVHTHPESDITGLVADLASKVPLTRLINTTAPLAGGGDLSADRTLSLTANGITDAFLRQGAATSVIGRSANSVGNVADIVSLSDGDVLRRSAGVLGFGAIPESSVTNLTADLAARPTGSGSTNTIPKWTGPSVLGNSSITDNGSLVTVANPLTVNGIATLGNATTIQHLVSGRIQLSHTATNANALIIRQTPAGGTTNATSAGDLNNNGTYNTTAGVMTQYGVAAQATGTRSSGTNALTNVALYANASGAQTNIALLTDNGSNYLNITSGSTGVGYSQGATLAQKFNVSGASLLDGQVDVNSHKIVNLTNGSAPSDAAAFGQIGTAINAAVSGTSGRSARFTSANVVGNGAFTDDGTNVSMTGTVVVNQTSNGGNAVTVAIPDIPSATVGVGSAGISVNGTTLTLTANSRVTYGINVNNTSKISAGEGSTNITNYAGRFFTSATGMSGATTYGVYAESQGPGANSFGIDAYSSGATNNYAVRGTATGVTSYGGYFTGDYLAVKAVGGVDITGTTSIGGLLNVASNFNINTNKFNVVAASGNTSVAGTLGVTGLSTLTGGFTLGADSSAGSHKITNLTNGSAAQDAAAFGQIGTAVNAAVSGTANTFAMFTGAHAVGDAPLSDNGTTLLTTRPTVQVFSAAASSPRFVLGQSGQDSWTLYQNPSASDLNVYNSTSGVAMAFDSSGNVSIGKSLSVMSGLSGAGGTPLALGNSTASTTSADIGASWTMDRTNGIVYQDTKIGATGGLAYRIGSGTNPGYTNTWLNVAGTGAASFPQYVGVGLAVDSNVGLKVAKPTGGTYGLYVSTGAAYVAETLSTGGNATLGDASTDTHTVNGNVTFSNTPTAGPIKYGSVNGRIYLGSRVITTTSSPTPTAGTKAIFVRMIGGGGGGGGAQGAASQIAAAGGGCSGAYLEKWIDLASSFTSYSVTIGTAGTAGVSTGGTGGSGGDTAFTYNGTTTLTAKGGAGGGGAVSVAASRSVAGGTISGASSTADVVSYHPGFPGMAIFISSSHYSMIAGAGGSTVLGTGGRGGRGDSGLGGGTSGEAGAGYGAGGGGSAAVATGNAGGAGSAGVVIIDEYA